MHLERRPVRLFERHQDVAVRRDEQRHVRQRVADRHRLDVRAGVRPGRKLLIIENVIDDSPRSIVGKILDLEMLLFPGGMERTEEQFRGLLARGGWTLTRVIPTAAPQSVIEAIPA